MWRHASEFAGHEQATADMSDCSETNEVMSYTITLAWFDAMLDLQGVRSTTSGPRGLLCCDAAAGVVGGMRGGAGRGGKGPAGWEVPGWGAPGDLDSICIVIKRRLLERSTHTSATPWRRSERNHGAGG